MPTQSILRDHEPTDEDIRILRRWLKKMPHIVQDYDDKFLATFIKGSKGSLQRAKIRLELFNGIGHRFPELYGHFDVCNPITQKCLKETIFFPLPQRLNSGSHVIIISPNFKDSESKKTHLLEIWRYWRMSFFVLAWENNHTTKSFTIIDWKNLRLGNAKEITPVIVSMLIEAHKSNPARVEAVYNVHVSPAFEWVYTMVKSMVKKKLLERSHFITSMDAIYEKVPKKILPKDYGGEGEDLQTMHNKWKEKVESYRDRLMEESSKMRKLDPIRPKREDLQDMVGTFKFLKLD